MSADLFGVADETVFYWFSERLGTIKIKSPLRRAPLCNELPASMEWVARLCAIQPGNPSVGRYMKKRRVRSCRTRHLPGVFIELAW